MDLRLLKLTEKFEAQLPNQRLSDAYLHLSRQLSGYYGRQTVRTSSELNLLHHIRKSTRLRFDHSYWIGNRNFDLFCPCLTGGSSDFELSPFKFKGLAIEVDGPIHNTPWKMRKDNSKYEFMHRLKIGMYVVENEDIRSNQVQALIYQLKKLPRLDTRARERVRRNIHLVTLMAHIENPLVKNLLNLNEINLVSQMKVLL